MYDEHDLIVLLKQNSEEALDALYEMYAARLFAFSLAYIKSREDAEELVQDTFVWLWEHRHSIRQEASIKNLLFIRTKHYLINAYRARVNSRIFEDYILYAESMSSDTYDKLEYDDFLNKVISISRRLTKTQRTVFLLSRTEQLNNKEIAARMKLSEQTVKNSLSIALKYIRIQLEKDNNEK